MYQIDKNHHYTNEIIYFLIVIGVILIDFLSRNMMGRRQDQIVPILVYLMVGFIIYLIQNITYNKIDLLYYFVIVFGTFFAFFSMWRPRVIAGRLDFSAYWISVLQVYNGIPFDGGASSFYGHYAYILYPILKLIGLSLESVALIQSGERVLVFLCLLYAIKKRIGKEYCILGGWFLIFAFSREIQWYSQTFPHRHVCTAIIVMLMAWLDNKKVYKYLLTLIFCIFSIIWNIETGVACSMAFSLYCFLICSKKISYFISISITPISFLLSWIITGLINILFGGRWLGIEDFCLPFFGGANNYVESIAYPINGQGSWVVIVPIFLFFLYLGIITRRQKNEYTAFLAAISLNALVVALYFFNRAAWLAFYTIVYYQFTIIILAVYKWSKKKYACNISKGIRKGIIFIAILYLAIFVYRFEGWLSILKTQQNSSDLKEIVKEIADDIPSDTIVFAESEGVLCIEDNRYHCYYNNIVNMTERGEEEVYQNIINDYPPLLLDYRGKSKINQFFINHMENFDEYYYLVDSYNTNPENCPEEILDLYMYKYNN